MKFKIKKIKLDLFKVLFYSFKYFYYILGVIVLIVIVTLGLFIYQYFYQTITQAEEVIILKKEVAPNTIDTNRVNRVIDSFKQKNNQEEINWKEIKNPFSVSAPDSLPDDAALNEQPSENTSTSTQP